MGLANAFFAEQSSKHIFSFSVLCVVCAMCSRKNKLRKMKTKDQKLMTSGKSSPNKRTSITHTETNRHKQAPESGQPEKPPTQNAADGPGGGGIPRTSLPKPMTESDIRERLERLNRKGREACDAQPPKTNPGGTTEAENRVSIAALGEHLYAQLFPMMAGEEMAQLAENIKMHGLQEPIMLYQSKVLDGRQRLAACKLAGVKPTFANFTGDDAAAVQFVLAKNIHRRNLTKSQRAAIAAELLLHFEKQAAERKRLFSGTRKNPDGTTPTGHVPEKIPGPAGEARKQAAQVLDVNERYVSDAKAVREEAPELHQQVKAGLTTLRAAKKKLAQKMGAPPESVEADHSESSNGLALNPKAETRKKWGKGALTVVVWDHQEDGDEPTKFFSRATYPSCVLFHIWPLGNFHLPRMGWRDHDVILTLLTDTNSVYECGGIRLRSAARLVSISISGDLPQSAVAFDGVLRFSDLLEQVERAWPTARRVLFGIAPRQRWETYVRRKRTQTTTQ